MVPIREAGGEVSQSTPAARERSESAFPQTRSRAACRVPEPGSTSQAPGRGTAGLSQGMDVAVRPPGLAGTPPPVDLGAIGTRGSHRHGRRRRSFRPGSQKARPRILARWRASCRSGPGLPTMMTCRDTGSRSRCHGSTWGPQDGPQTPQPQQGLRKRGQRPACFECADAARDQEEPASCGSSLVNSWTQLYSNHLDESALHPKVCNKTGSWRHGLGYRHRAHSSG